MSSARALPSEVPVLVAGGGPVGLTAAALLARQGISCLTLESDPGFCEGSRAICISRRSQEILGWIGADRPLIAKGLPWVGGRSFFRDAEVLRFEMPTEPTERFAPMVNIQQFYVERFAHEALAAAGGEVRWSSRVCAVRAGPGEVEVDVVTARGLETVRTHWLIACDGGRSTVRELLALPLEGTQYEGRYVIVDIEQHTERKVERLAWFDPPSNPGSTILMHRQPDNVWRIDYQLREGEDPQEAVRPDNVLPRVQAHLDMIGERAPWKPLWISIYNAKCLTLPSYRAGRVLFAGDAAHLVPIFGVRGLNSGLDDAGNIAWKLAQVLRGASDSLLDSYSLERVAATRENIAYGAKSTEFMAPPNHGFSLLREAALRLALVVPQVRTLINPRQTAPAEYRGSPLNLPDRGDFAGGARAGMPAPEAKVWAGGHATHLTAAFGSSFTALLFSERDELPGALQSRGPEPSIPGIASAGDSRLIRIVRVAPGNRDPAAALRSAHGRAAFSQILVDDLGEAWQRYDAVPGTLYMIRPDGYVMGRWRDVASSADSIDSVLQRVLRGSS